MLLRDVNNNTKRFDRVNSYLKENFGFSLSADVSTEQLLGAKKEITLAIRESKVHKNLTPKDSELSKQLLVLEGLNLLIEESKKTQLQEFAMPGIKHGPYSNIVDFLSEFVMKHVTVGDDLDDAVQQAMKEYRSSKYRYNDDEVEYDVRKAVTSLMASPIEEETAGINQPTYQFYVCRDGKIVSGFEYKEDAFELIQSEPEFYRGAKVYTAKGLKQKYNIDPADPANWEGEELEEYNVDDTGRDVVDPSAKAKAERFLKAKGTTRDWDDVSVEEPGKKYKATNKPTPTKRGEKAMFNIDMSEEKQQMKENYIKELRTLLEGEVEQAEVIIAAKGFSKELQDMIEKVGRLMNEDLGPVSDQMRQTYGYDVSSNFQVTMQAELEGVLDALRGAKERMDDSVATISTGAAPDISMDAEFSADEDGLESGEFDMEVDGDIDAELDGEIGDEFGGDAAAVGPEEEPLGRAALESKIVEMRQELSKIRKIKEQRSLKNK